MQDSFFCDTCLRHVTILSFSALLCAWVEQLRTFLHVLYAWSNAKYQRPLQFATKKMSWASEIWWVWLGKHDNDKTRQYVEVLFLLKLKKFFVEAVKRPVTLL